MKRFAILLLLFAGLAVTPAKADDLVVVELFTAQGCDKCPPADVLLEDLSRNPNVLPLSWHVDYWDFMGWKDSLAQPSHKDRQEAYNKAMGNTGVMTPEFVVNGRSQVTGPKKLALYQEISNASLSNDLNVTVRISEHPAGYSIKIGGPPRDGTAEVRMIWYDPLVQMDIKGGANSGKKMDYVNVVTKSKVVGDYTGGKAAFILNPGRTSGSQGDGCIAILVQEENAGPILGAGNFCPQ